MLLSEISYEILTILRGGNVVDDERIDTRLLDALIHQYRVSYAKEITTVAKTIPESLIQTTNIDIALTERATFKSLESANTIPRIIVGKFGPLISSIYSPYVDEYSYTIVNRNQLNFSGNGKFNDKVVYASYIDNRIALKSKNKAFNSISDINISGVFEDPTQVEEFDVDTDHYPIDSDGITYIKAQFMQADMKILLGQFSDEINDSSGEIKNG